MNWSIILLAAVVILPPVVIMIKNQYGTKRGCGRGCATCGNRHICHGTGAYRDHPHSHPEKGTDEK